MKDVLIIILLASVFGLMIMVGVHIDNHRKNQITTEKSSIITDDFNKTKDDFVVNHFLQKPIFTLIQGDNELKCYTIRFTDYEFKIYHKSFIPFEQQEEWMYTCKSINGEYILIQSFTGTQEHKLSQNTYKMIRDYCLNMENN